MSENTTIYGDEITLTETEAAAIHNTMIRALEQHVKEPLYPGDERRIYAEGLVAVFVALYNTMNDVGRQTLLRYARGAVLDEIGKRVDVKRLSGDYAKTVLRFSVSTAQTENIIIPKWTKATPDGSCHFATDEIAVLQAGTYSVDVPASCTEPGEKYNGYAEGTISTLVDLIPYIEAVENVTETTGGDDGEPYTTEGDDRLRERIRLAPAKQSTAGPEMAYTYWAMTADSSIIDVKAVSETETITRTLTVYASHAFLGGDNLLPDTLKITIDGAAAVEGIDYTANYTDGLLSIVLDGTAAAAATITATITRTLEGRVKLVTLTEGGTLPDESVLQKVFETVDAKKVRPMTDHVEAVAPVPVPYDIELVYYTTPETEAEVVNNVEGAGGAIQQYKAWQCEALGRDVNPDKLRSLILAPRWADNLTGAIRVDIVAPSHTTVTAEQVAQFSGNITVSHKAVTGVV